MILVTGGAGYIGSHIAKKLLEDNQEVLVLDNFSTGFLEPVEILKNKYSGLEYINADLLDKGKLNEIFSKFKIEAVMHLAAKIDVSESLLKPDEYHRVNYEGGVNLIDAMTAANVNKIIFSSTAAVYGNPQYTPIDENHSTSPLNPYGQTKLDFEKYLSECKNLQYIIFRFFNVGGASTDGLIGKSHLQSQDLIENIMKVNLGQKDNLDIFGDKFDTPDGFAIRDFIHVEDVAQAHLLALKKINNRSLDLARDDKVTFNLGSEHGFSVKETIEAAAKIIGKKIPIKILPPRESEISISVASAKKAQELLDWEPINSNLETIILTDWNWRKTHPMGYNK